MSSIDSQNLQPNQAVIELNEDAYLSDESTISMVHNFNLITSGSKEMQTLLANIRHATIQVSYQADDPSGFGSWYDRTRMNMARAKKGSQMLIQCFTEKPQEGQCMFNYVAYI